MCDHCMNRRQFNTLTTAAVGAGLLGATSTVRAALTEIDPWDPDKPLLVTGRPLRIQPILAHANQAPREKASWRSWGEVVNEAAAAEDMQRIASELKALQAKADFPLEILPAIKVATEEEAVAAQQSDFDVVLLYAASNARLFQPCCASDPRRDTIVFVRHRAGPTYYGYECLGTRFFFVIVPVGMLLRHIAGKPVFMHNSTFPHKAMVTCAHCTAPRRMDGRRYEPARIMTHYESDFGAAPKIEMPIGQLICAISPEYATGRWVGIRGVVRDNPNFAICRSQQDVEILGDWRRLIAETRDSHWMMVYGDYLREAGYAARKIGLVWDNVSDMTT